MANTKKEPGKEPYVLRKGHQHNGFDEKTGERKVFKEGETVMLTPNQAEAFKDKFDSEAEIVARADVAKRRAQIEREVRAQLEAEQGTAKRPDPTKEETGEQNANAGTKGPAVPEVETAKVDKVGNTTIVEGSNTSPSGKK